MILVACQGASLRGDAGQVLQMEENERGIGDWLAANGKSDACRCFTRNPANKLGCCTVVHRHRHRAEQQAGPERGHPFGAVWAPEQDAITGAYTPLAQLVSACEGDGA